MPKPVDNYAYRSCAGNGSDDCFDCGNDGHGVDSSASCHRGSIDQHILVMARSLSPVNRLAQWRCGIKAAIEAFVYVRLFE